MNQFYSGRDIYIYICIHTSIHIYIYIYYIYIYIYIYISNCLRPSRHRALNRSPRTLFGYPGHLRGSLLGTPGLPHGRFLVALGTSWSPLGPLLVPGRKKRRKVTWRTLALGSKLGLKIVTFPEKAATNMKKWAPRQGLEKGSCLEGVKTLKVMTLTALWAVF